LFVYTRIRDFLQHEFLFGFIQCMFADERTIICSYSVRTGAMNRRLRLRNVRCYCSHANEHTHSNKHSVTSY
ncbi:hypothetical protein, partial [Prevotella pallens]|uniref:hypothetical protein n=1 Tax=Prevotella pallens TaxID=60133 RepID=UPI0023F1D8EB